MRAFISKAIPLLVKPSYYCNMKSLPPKFSLIHSWWQIFGKFTASVKKIVFMCNSQNQAVAWALVNPRQKTNHALSSRLLSFIGWPAFVLFSNLEERSHHQCKAIIMKIELRRFCLKESCCYWIMLASCFQKR